MSVPTPRFIATKRGGDGDHPDPKRGRGSTESGCGQSVWSSSEVQRLRREEGFPVTQQLLQLLNPTSTLCYANAGTNLLFSSPAVSRFLAELPPMQGLGKVVREIARAFPGRVLSLQWVRKHLAEVVPAAEVFLNDHRQEDSNEWVVTLIEGISNVLSVGLQRQWEQLFTMEIGEQYRCTGMNHIRKGSTAKQMCLQLPIVDCGNPITDLTSILSKYFDKEVIDCQCMCGAKKAVKELSIETLPQVLLLQYLRFTSDGRKLAHGIQSGMALTIHGVTYGLMGLLEHKGRSIRSGHYVAMTRCALSKQCYMTDDKEDPRKVSAGQFAAAGRRAYMLCYQKLPSSLSKAVPVQENNQPRNQEHVSVSGVCGPEVPESGTTAPEVRSWKDVLVSGRRPQSMSEPYPRTVSSREAHDWTGLQLGAEQGIVQNETNMLQVPDLPLVQENNLPTNVEPLVGFESGRQVEPEPEKMDPPAEVAPSLKEVVGRADQSQSHSDKVCDPQPTMAEEQEPLDISVNECEMVRLQDQVSSILQVPLKERTKEQKNKIQNLRRKINKLKSKQALPTTEEVQSKEGPSLSKVGSTSEQPQVHSNKDSDPQPEVVVNSTGAMELDVSACESEVIEIRCRMSSILAVPKKERDKKDMNEYQRLKRRLDKLMSDFPHLKEAKKQAQTPAEKKAAYRQRQSEEAKEKALAANRERMASEANMAATRERMASEANMAATRERVASEANMAATRERVASEANLAAHRVRTGRRRSNVTVQPRDGLQNELILKGHFHVPVNNIGEMNHECDHCGALRFKRETGSSCCLDGKVILERFTKPTEPFLRLWFKDDDEASVFRKYSRSFNNGLCLSSLRVNERRFRGYTPSIVFEGRVHQYVGPLQAMAGEQPRFAQLYVHDPALETSARVANMSMPSSLTAIERTYVHSIVDRLQTELKRINKYVRDFRQIVELGVDDLQGGHLVISAKARPAGTHSRQYNLTVDLEEVSVLTNSHPHDLVITPRDGGLQVVSDLNPNAMPLHFTVLFPNGDKGWDQEQRINGKRVTTRQFYAFHLAVRDKLLTYEEASSRDVVDYIHRGGRLFQEFICMGWIKTENQRLNYQAINQKALRADSYKNVRQCITDRMALSTRGDALFHDDHAIRTGTKILARSFVGSPRWYHMQFLDAMAICREFHKPDYFITITCNPKWSEIQSELLPGQNPEDRPDVTARVFKQKLDAIMDDLVKGNLLGRADAHLLMTEFQKKGLPHDHLLLIVAAFDRLTTGEQVDSVICAELPPDPATAENEAARDQMQRLEDIVKRNMIHGPCGPSFPSAPCMEDGKCTKHYPKEFQKHTLIESSSGFPTYRRRTPEDGGRTISITRGGATFQVTNRDVVPYNPYLTLKYDCHINVEKSTSPRNCKYLYKYVTKGADRAMVSAEVGGEERPRDEISDYKDLRSVGSQEAMWHLLGYPISRRYPAVQVLRVHQEDEQHVVFDEGEEELALETQRVTELTQFFELNKKLKDSPDKWLKYVDMPKDYTWNKKSKNWKIRSQHSGTIGRVDNIHPAAGDSFYLRMLLNSEHCKGKTSFVDLRTVGGGQPCETYKEACQKLGMLQTDLEWEKALEDASHNRSCVNIRLLYVTIIVWCAPANPRALFDKFWLDWVDDLVAKASKQGVNLDVNRAEDQQLLKTLVLLDLKQLLYAHEKELLDFQLTEPTSEEEASVEFITEGRSVVIREELDFDVAEIRDRAQDRQHNYTEEQRVIHQKVLEAVENNTPKCFFIKARGGCGKTFLLNGLLWAIRGLHPGGCVALATATTGKAARHLDKGRTFHSRFKAPLTLSDDCRLRIPVQSELSKLVQMAKVILVDEATMLDNRLMQALDESLKDIMRSDVVFGGKVIVMSGDFRQTLPVIKGASRAGIVSRCINQHPLWQHFEVVELTINMRVLNSGDPQLEAWDEWLLRVGNGEDGDLVAVPEEICFEIEASTRDKPTREDDSLKKLINIVYPDLRTNLSDQSWLEGRSILTPTNKNVDIINHTVVGMTAGTEVVLHSADAVDNIQDARSFSVEYCNSLNPTGLPSHILTLKPNVPVMLLRNLDSSSGLCNGARLTFKSISANGCVMYCDLKDEITNEIRTVAIPRIPLRPKEKEYPFEWCRLQFPIRAAFATTINKSQGDTLKKIGVWLKQPVFGHGQFYVAPSRVGAMSSCTFAIKCQSEQPYNVTRNVVYTEVLGGQETSILEAVVPEIVLPAHEVADITEWLDYSAIEAEFESDFSGEAMVEESGPTSAEEIRRRVSRTRATPVGLSIARAQQEVPPPILPYVPPVYVPSCQYEQIREDNIQERNAEFLRIFGVPLDGNNGGIVGMVEDEE